MSAEGVKQFMKHNLPCSSAERCGRQCLSSSGECVPLLAIVTLSFQYLPVWKDEFEGVGYYAFELQMYITHEFLALDSLEPMRIGYGSVRCSQSFVPKEAIANR